MVDASDYLLDAPARLIHDLIYLFCFWTRTSEQKSCGVDNIVLKRNNDIHYYGGLKLWGDQKSISKNKHQEFSGNLDNSHWAYCPTAVLAKGPCHQRNCGLMVSATQHRIGYFDLDFLPDLRPQAWRLGAARVAALLSVVYQLHYDEDLDMSCVVANLWVTSRYAQCHHGYQSRTYTRQPHDSMLCTLDRCQGPAP